METCTKDKITGEISGPTHPDNPLQGSYRQKDVRPARTRIAMETPEQRTGEFFATRRYTGKIVSEYYLFVMELAGGFEPSTC